MPTMAEVRAKFPQYNDMSDQQLAGALHKKFYSDMPEAEFNAKVGLSAPQAPVQAQAAPNPRSFQDAEMKYLQNQQAAQIPARSRSPDPTAAHVGALPGYQGDAALEASQAGLLGGYDDELKAAMNAPIDAIANVVRGGSFNPVEAYTARQKGYDQQKAARRAEHPIASLGGELLGGLALGGSVRGAPAAARAPAPAAPMSISNRLAPYVGRTGASALEGAGYGAVYGSGEAKPGERLAGAGKGAAVGFGTGAALETFGGALANRAGMRQMAKTPPAPGADQLAADAHALYAKADQAGVTIKPASFAKVVANAKLAAGGINTTLRPNTAGVLDDIAALQGQPLSLGRLDELRQEVGLAMKRAQPQDVRTLERVKSVIDNFADNATPADITGDIRGFQHIKEARKLWARKAKTEVVNKILDMADVRTGQYTQSGLANTIVKEMRTLYKSIQSGRTKGFTADEIALVRQMAKGGSNSRAVNLLAKFAPRGVVSTLGGFALGGPALTLAGHVGGVMADRGAMTAASKLRDATARGYIPQVPQLPNRLRPFIPAGTAGATEIQRLLSMPEN